jgi:hypothetical protein
LCVPRVHGEELQTILGRVDVVEGEIILALLELLYDPSLDLIVGLASGFDGLLVDLYRVLLVDLREERQPAQSNGQRVHVRRVVELGQLLGPGSPLGIEGHVVVSPLTGMEVP